MEPLIALMRRYCIHYTNAHDFSVCDEIMDPAYTLHMGGHHLAGRDEAYKPATAKQFEQFPGLCLTVQEIVTSGNRMAMRFTEHGASVRHGSSPAAWAGIGLYRWDGLRLVENFVEQDYFSRRRQLTDAVPDSIEPPAVAPWDAIAEPPLDKAEAVVRRWLEDSILSEAITSTADVLCDEGIIGQPIVDADSITIDELFSAGEWVGFHTALHGRYTGGLGDEVRSQLGAAVVMHVAGLVRVHKRRVVSGRVVRDRLGVYKTLRDAA